MKYNFLLVWLTVAIVTTLLCGLIYATVQQSYRQSANDPQMAIAEDVADLLRGGVDPKAIVSGQSFDISKSLSPFIIAFDQDGNPLASSAKLDSKTPTPPHGVFEYTKSHGEDIVTWQPKPSVRIAAVITYYTGGKSGFVLAGRNIHEIEKREDKLAFQVFIGWLVILLVSFSSFFVLENFCHYLLKFLL